MKELMISSFVRYLLVTERTVQATARSCGYEARIAYLRLHVA